MVRRDVSCYDAGMNLGYEHKRWDPQDTRVQYTITALYTVHYKARIGFPNLHKHDCGNKICIPAATAIPPLPSMASTLVLPAISSLQWLDQSNDASLLDCCRGAEFSDDEEVNSILYSPRFDSRCSSFDFDQAMEEYEWFCQVGDSSDSLSVLDDHHDDPGEFEDYFDTYEVDPRSTVSLPADALRSLMGEDDFVPPLKRCETATRCMLRQMRCGERLPLEETTGEADAGQSERTASPAGQASVTCRKSMAKLSMASFRALLVPFKREKK